MFCSRVSARMLMTRSKETRRAEEKEAFRAAAFPRALKRWVVSILQDASPEISLTPLSANPSEITRALPERPLSEPVAVTHLILRVMIVLSLGYFGYHGVLSRFTDPFLVQVNAKLDEFGATPDQRQEFSNRIIQELQRRKIDNEAIIEFMKGVDLKVSTDPEVLYNSFMALAEKYAALERLIADLRTSSDVEIRTL